MRPFLKSVLWLIAGWCLFCISCTSMSTPVAGGGSSETVIGMVVDSGGHPSVNAVVRLRASNYTAQSLALAKTSIYSADALTDRSGRFEFSGIDPGSYRIEVTDGRAAVLFGFSLNVSDTVDLGVDTLRAFATIAGTIDTAGHAGQQAYVKIDGLERIAAVNDSGRFVIADLPAGTFTVRAVAARDRVISAASGVTVSPGESTDVPVLYGWRFSRRLYINTTSTGAGVVEDVTGFPLLIRLDPANFDFPQAQDSGQDIRFAKADGSLLPYEIESWDATAHSAAIWIRADTIYGNSDRHFIVMWWGNPGLISESSGAAVFDTALGFAGVWQMSSSGAIAGVADQTGRHADGIATGVWSTGGRIEGVVGGALQFNGVDNAVLCATNMGQIGTNSATISAWIKTNYASKQSVLSYQNDQSRLRIAMENRIWFGLLPNSSTWLESPTQGPYLSPLLADGKWHHVMVVYDRNSQARLFVDGDAYDSLSIASEKARYLSADSLIIGYDNFISSYYNGAIDEVRLESAARSAAWVRLCYKNQQPDQRLVSDHK